MRLKGRPTARRWMDLHARHFSELLWTTLVLLDPVSSNQSAAHARQGHLDVSTKDLWTACTSQVHWLAALIRTDMLSCRILDGQPNPPRLLPPEDGRNGPPQADGGMSLPVHYVLLSHG